MKVIIIGGGVGGIASAIALSADHEVEVYEQADQLRTDGNGVLLYPNGTGLLREFGVPLDGLGCPMEALDLLADDGTQLMRLELARISDRFGFPIVVTKRGMVLQLLSDRLTDGKVHFGKRLTAIEHRPNSLTVSFSDGTTAEGDVVIGADGHRSAVRCHLFGDDPAASLGDATWHGITSLRSSFVQGNRIHSLYGKEGICVVHPVGDGQVYWAFELPWTEGDNIASPVESMRARFADWTASVMPELLDSITDDDISIFPHILHSVRPYWAEGPLTLVGDAAHAVPPRLGMGLCQALEDAWVLGRTMAQPGSPAERLRAYERARWPRISRMHATAKLMGRNNLPLPPGLLRAIGGWLPMTAYQTAQVKRLSNFLNGDAFGIGGDRGFGRRAGLSGVAGMRRNRE